MKRRPGEAATSAPFAPLRTRLHLLTDQQEENQYGDMNASLRDRTALCPIIIKFQIPGVELKSPQAPSIRKEEEIASMFSFER